MHIHWFVLTVLLQGAIFPLVAEALRQLQRDYPMSHCWISSQHLQQYILCCCQTQKGGIEDKPGK